MDRPAHLVPPQGSFDAASSSWTETWIVVPDLKQVKSLGPGISKRRLRRLTRDLAWVSKIALERGIPLRAILIGTARPKRSRAHK